VTDHAQQANAINTPIIAIIDAATLPAELLVLAVSAAAAVRETPTAQPDQYAAQRAVRQPFATSSLMVVQRKRSFAALVEALRSQKLQALHCMLNTHQIGLLTSE
jgi:hypothetical protein